jgi:hypothetical protein
MKRFLAAFVLAISAGCAPTQVNLTEQGKAVELVTQAATADCQVVDLLTCQIGSNFKSYEDNVDNCKNQLRNEAAEKGATHLSFNSPERDTGGGLSDDSCKNCVNMSAQALTCGEASSTEGDSSSSSDTQCYKWQSDYEECIASQSEE